MKFQFEKKLSLDGVAIIIGIIAALLWIGSLKQQIQTLQTASDAHSLQLTEVNQGVAQVKSDVAVLSAVVVERTGKPLK